MRILRTDSHFRPTAKSGRATASKLLRQTKMSIEEIADRSGFNSRSTFRRAFLKRFGSTPSHYRLQHLPKEIEKEISLTQ